jgi:hypothetical protein
MSFFGFILIVLLLMVLVPLIKGWLYMQNVKRRINESFRGRQQHERPRREDNDEYTDTGERKIYTSRDGEYAEYEEVSGTIIEETTADRTTRIVIEEQVTDAEYEEL